MFYLELHIPIETDHGGISGADPGVGKGRGTNR